MTTRYKTAYMRSRGPIKWPVNPCVFSLIARLTEARDAQVIVFLPENQNGQNKLDRSIDPWLMTQRE